MTPPSAADRQIAAADPRRNTWTSANAGSGKTRVLTDRVARLLLNGADPQHILCLTYTKAAATEMQNRLFDRLGGWAMQPEDSLRRSLAALGEADLDAGRIARARQLFARAIESPGGLRIQTIHSFCASLLRRFPLEAGVTPGFAEMDDRSARLMRADILQDLAEGPHAPLIQRLTEVEDGETFDQLVSEIGRHRSGFCAAADTAAIHQALGLPAVLPPDYPLGIAFRGGEDWLIARSLPLLRAGSITMQDLAKLLAGINFQAPTRADLAKLYDGLLKADGQPNFAKVPTVKVRSAMGDMVHEFDDFMERVAAAHEAEKALAAAERTLALHGLAGAFLEEYAARKAARGLLDFDDLILRAKALLTDPALAAWVLYRLDGSIDHILVDEAQDTSPDQWQLVQALAAELIAGEGANPRPRTLFVVGDKKQSIYSFQGADVAAFDRMRAHFAERLAGGAALADGVLQHSFRSSPAILAAVDRCFLPEHAAALGGAAEHHAFFPDLPGRVDVWPVVTAEGAPDPGPWYQALDSRAPQSPAVQLAEKLAAWIKARIDEGTQLPQVPRDGGPDHRPMRFGDVLILVRRRSDLFHETIRACKALGLPIAGADRLKLGGELAVKDLTALLAFLDTPEDDLALASVLRSPLCGWTEGALYRLAHGRKGFLWEALRDHDGAPETRAFLDDLRAQADFLRPYDLLERVLYRHDGRARLIGRLGAEAEDGIDELLGQALAYERAEVPSLTGFLVWMRTDDVEVKRPPDAEGDQIRVMTVHGAKGLEADVVILPDCGNASAPDREMIFRVKGLPVRKTAVPDSPDAIAVERAARQAREADERLRLLYVALTRARTWAVAAAAGKTDQPDAWINLIRAGVLAAGGEEGEGILRLSHGTWPQPVPGQAAAAPDRPAPPDWAGRPAPAAARSLPALSPSDLGGAKALPGEPVEPDAFARARGTALHLLLERLPGTDRERWPGLAAALVPDAALRGAALSAATRVLDDPALAPLFAPGTLAEVAAAAPWRDRLLMGSMDRLIVAPDHVLVVDFKSNHLVPDRPDQVPEGLLRQLGAYAQMLAAVFPGRRVETAILWTQTPRLMRLDPEIVRAAFDRAAIS